MNIFDNLTSDEKPVLTPEMPSAPAWIDQEVADQQQKNMDLATRIKPDLEVRPQEASTPEFNDKLTTAKYMAEMLQLDPVFVWNNYETVKTQYQALKAKTTDKGDAKAITDDFNTGDLYLKKTQIDTKIKEVRDYIAHSREYLAMGTGAPLDQVMTAQEKASWEKEKARKELEIVDLLKQRAEIDAKLPTFADDRTRDWFTEARKTVVRSAPAIGDMVVKATVGAAAAVATGGAASLSIGAGLAYAGMGANAGMLLSNAEQTGGQIYGDLIDAGASHDVASQTANMGIFLTSPLALAQLNVATKVVSGPLSGMVSQAIIKSLGETTKQLATKRTAGAIAAKIAVDYSGRVAGQEILAATQSIVTDLSFNFGANLENELNNSGIEPRQIKEVVERAKQAMADSLLTMAMIEGVPAVRMGLRARKDLTGASNKIQAIMENAPQTDPALMKAVTMELATGRPEVRAQEFQARQADETTRSKVVTTDGQTMQVYHAGAEADGSIHFFENPEAAAQRADAGNWSIRSDELVRAVQERYGRPSAEYIHGLIDGKRNLTAKVEADIPEATRLKIEEVAQYVDGIKKIPELVHDTIQELGIKAPETHILPAQIDAQSVVRTMDRSQVPELLKDHEAVILDGPDGAEVILKDPALAIVDAPLAVKNWRIPKENGRIISEDSGTAYHALDPNTKEKVATLGYDRMGDTAVIRDVPENPRLAHELIQDFKAKNEKIILDLPPDTRDALARQNPERQAAAAEVNKLTTEQRNLEKSFDADLAAASATDKAQVIDSYGKKANALQERMRAALDELDAVDQEYLGESKPDPLTTTREEIQQFAETKADRIDTAREELKARMIAEAPQIPVDELDASMQIIDVRAAAMGLTPDQWIKRFMTNAEITNDVLNSGRAKGLVSFLDDGRAILKLSQKADAGTIVHELGHIVRRQLSDEDTKILADHYKTDANKPWTIEAEERFAEDFQRYFMENKRPPKGLEKVFATIQHFMKSLYAWLSGDLDQNVRGVIDRAFQKQGDEVVTLFQPADPTDSQAFKSWFGESKVVDEQGKPLVVYHGREGNTLEKFNTESRDGYHNRKLSVPYFSAFKEYSKEYGKNLHAVYLSIKNPIELSYGEIANLGTEEVARYISQGYDGAIHHDFSFGDMGFDGRFFEVSPFSPEQVKSIDNRGTWNPQDPRILYATDRLDPARLDDLMGQVSKLEARRFDMIQGFDDPAKMPEVDSQIAELKGQADDYRLALKADAQKATAAGEYVSRQTLEQFAGEQWADDALDQMDMEAAMDFSEDAFEAIEPETIANLDREIADEQNATGNYDTAPERIGPMTRAEANKAWQALIDKDGESILNQIRGVYKDRKGLEGADLEHFREISWGGPVNKAIMVSRYEKVGPVRADAIKHLRENGDVYREKWARFNQDWEAIQESNRIDQAEPLPTTAADQAKIKALSVEDRIQHIRDMVRTGMKDRAAGEIDTTYAEVSKELTRLTLANKAQMGKIQELDSRISSMISAKMKLDNKLDYAERDLAKAETAANRDQKTINELKDRRDQLKAEKSALSAEWKDKYQAEHEALMSARKEARTLQEFTAEQVKAKYAQRDQLRRLREYKTELMARIMKKPGDSINFDEAEAIRELQASLDPDSHGMKYQSKRDGMRKWFAEHPDMFKALNTEIQDMITKLSKDELTIDQLEGLNTQVERLKEIGRIKRQMVKEARRQALLQDVADLTSAVLNGQEYDATDPKMRKNGGAGGTFAEAVRDATTPQALMDKLDGGRDYQGTWMKRVWNKVSDTWAASREGINRRMDGYAAKAKELQIDPVELNRQKHVILDRAIQTDATKDKAIMSRWLTLQEAMGVYMAEQMEDGQKALRDGFRLTESDIAKVIDSVPANYRQLADWIIDHGYGDHTERLRRATIDYTNQDMALIDRYSPILRFEDDGNSLDKQIVDDLMRDTPAGNKYVARGMTKARTMTGKFQKPMRLDCLDIFREMVEKQEHFIHMGEQVRHFNGVFRNTDLRAAITVAHGEGWAKQLDGWIQRVANPDLFAAKTSESRLARAIRNNAAMAYLGFRIPTALKAWITGPMYSMAEAPVELAANLAKTGYGLAIPVTKKLYARMVRLAPEMEARTISRPYAEMQRANAKKLVRLHMVEAHAYDMLTWGQRFCDAVTWNAVMDKNLKGGLDEKAAAREATNYILRTQPVGDAKDQSAMGANKGFASVLTQFMSQGNQLWNDMSLIRIMQTLKNKNASPKAKAAMARKLGIQIAGITMAGAIYALFSMKKMPETEEDWQKLAFETANGQVTTMLPWIGGAASAGLSGFGYDMQIMTPVTGIATGVKTTSEMMGALATGEDITGKQVANTIKALAESAAIIMGKPYLAPKQIVDAAGNQMQTPDMDAGEVAASWAQYLILGGKAK